MSRSLILAALLFAGLCLVPGLRGPFVHDDANNLSLVLTKASSWAEALDVTLSNDSGPFKRPIANASFLANYMLAGDSALAFKTVNVLLHLTCGLLLFLLGRELTRRILPQLPHEQAEGLALVTALLWVAHPLNVSTVLYVVQRMTVMSTLFSLWALWLLARHFNAPDAEQRPLRILLAFHALTLLAILSKESGALTPLYAGVVAIALGWRQGKAFVRQHRTVLVGSVAAPLLAGLLLFGLGAEHFLSGYGSRQFTLWQRIATEPVVLWQYLGHILGPFPLRMHFFWDNVPVRNLSDHATIAALIAWVAAGATAIRIRHTSILPLFAVAWYLAGHAMESTILPLELAYEHRNYLPMFGPLFLLIVILHRVASRLHLPLRTSAIAVLAIVMAMTGWRSFTWSSMARFAAHEVTVAPDSSRAQFNAYNIALARQDWHAAQNHLKAIRELESDAGWVELIPLIAFCYGDPHPLDFAKTRKALLASATDVHTVRGMPQLVSLVSSHSCRQTLPIDVDKLLLSLADTAIADRSETTAADYLYMASSLAWARGDMTSCAARLRRATQLAPQADKPLEQLITVELIRGNPVAAREVLEQARQLWAARFPWRLYRHQRWLHEIDSFERASPRPPAAS